MQSCCGCSFHWVFDVTDCCCFWKMVLCRFGISGVSAWSGRMCCSDAEYRWAFLRRGFSCGGCDLTRLWMRCRVDVRGLVGLSGPGSRMSSPCWERLEFPFVVSDPTDSGQRSSCPGSSEARALHIPDADHLPLCLWVLKLVCVCSM